MAKQVKSISDLTPDKRNANKGTVRGLAMLEDSLQKYGAGRSILIDKNGNVIAGNKTLGRAAELGLDVEVVQTDGNKLVAVQRTDLDLYADPKARELAYADNRVAEVDLSWDAQSLLADMNDGVNLEQFFDQDELDALLAGLNDDDPPGDPGAQVDRADELQTKWQVKRGDLYVIPSKSGKGEHRLLCGDSTNADGVARVMQGEKARLVVTDPPYGVDYERGKFDGTPRKSNMPTQIANDNYKGEDQRAFIYKAFSAARVGCKDNACVYMFSAQLQEGCYSMFGLQDAGVHIQSQLIWNKSHLVLGRSDYQWKHEVVWYGYWDSKDRVWNGERDQTTVIDATKISASLHPNEKPVDLMSYFIGNSSNTGETVLDLFAGSGSTVAACEQSKRLGCGIELEEKYVAVALERLASMGLEPRKAE